MRTLKILSTQNKLLKNSHSIFMFHYYAIKDYKNAHTFIVKIGVCKITLNYINPFPEGTKGPKIHFNLIYIEEYKKK